MSGNRTDLSIVAVDIGATKLAIQAKRGRQSWCYRREWSSDLELLTQVVRQARQRLGGHIDRVGVACAASLDRDGRISTWPSRPLWIGQPIREMIAGAAQAPLVIGDDGALAALAEAEAASCRDLVYLGLGTGVAGGIVADGRLLTGAHGTGGEIGHVPVDPRGPVCRCGRTGCVQAFAAGPALARRASALRGAAATERELADGVARGEPWAVRTLDEAVTAIARAITIVSEVVQPQRVHLGGGLGIAVADLPCRLTEALHTLARPGRPMPTVAHAHFGADASLAGAVTAASLGGTRLPDPKEI